MPALFLWAASFRISPSWQRRSMARLNHCLVLLLFKSNPYNSNKKKGQRLCFVFDMFQLLLCITIADKISVENITLSLASVSRDMSRSRNICFVKMVPNMLALCDFELSEVPRAWSRFLNRVWIQRLVRIPLYVTMIRWLKNIGCDKKQKVGQWVKQSFHVKKKKVYLHCTFCFQWFGKMSRRSRVGFPFFREVTLCDTCFSCLKYRCEIVPKIYRPGLPNLSK